MKVIYDTEVYPNILLYVFKDIKTKKTQSFHISQFRDDRFKLLEFLKNIEEMIGFNNLNYDYPIFEQLMRLLRKDIRMRGRDILLNINKVSDDLVRSQMFRKTPRNVIIKQVDLFKIHHFDNKSKLTSLKSLEFVMHMPNIQELPFAVGTTLTEQECLILDDYCHNDVEATYRVYMMTEEEILLRERLSELYGMDFTNYNDPKIGEDILVHIIKKKTGREYLGKTHRESIAIGEIIFPYVKFISPEFNAIKSWMQERVIKETKDVFTKLPLDTLGEVGKYANLEKNMILKKSLLKTLNVVFNGMQFNFGVGGLHSSIAPDVYEENADYAILDIDVESYYPNLGIRNRLYPEHLGEEFCDIYEGIFDLRRTYKKGTVENKGLKLALNGAYGKSNSEFSDLYDPKYTMSITINGQLLLCMLAEWLAFVPSITILQSNTDGITLMYKKNTIDQIMHICNKWMQMTKLNLEMAAYRKMVIRDVNNYIAIKHDGSVKRKGAFEYERVLSQNHSMLIIPKAIEAYYVHGINTDDFIMNHRNLWDYFKATKLTRTSVLIGRTDVYEREHQRITRYVVTREGEQLIKLMPPLSGKSQMREFQIEAGYVCTVANHVDNQFFAEMPGNINYEYYMREANKIKNVISTHSVEDDDVFDE